MFNWEDLRYFLAVAQAGSLSGAARLLQVDHATVSRRINALESHLHSRLIDRQARACYLTELGEQILTLSRDIENSAFAIERAAQADRLPMTGRVSVSAPPVLAANLLVKRLFDFRQRYPDIQLSIASQPSLISLSRREADIALRLIRPTDNNDVARKLGLMPFALYANKSYAFLHQPSQWQFIGYDAQFSEMPHAKWISAIAGKRPLSCEVSDISSQYIAALSSVGVAALPQFIGDADSQLQRLDFSGEPFAPEIWLGVHADLRHSPLLRTVMDFIIETIDDFIIKKVKII